MDCWQTIKSFDEFCQRIVDVHLQQNIVVVKCDEIHTPIVDDVIYPYIEPTEDIKPTATELQETFALKVEQSQLPSSDQNQEEGTLHDDLARTLDDNDEEYTAFDDIPDTWSDTNSDDYFVTSEDVAKQKRKSSVSAAKRGRGRPRKDGLERLQKRSHTTKVQDNTDTYVCEFCGHKARSKQGYIDHIESFHMDNTYECDICGDR